MSIPSMVNKCALFLLCLTAVSTAGCGGSSAEKRLIGQWKMDQAERLANRMFDGASDKLPIDPGDLSGGLAVIVEFRKGGELQTRSTVMNIESTKRGNWEVLKSESDQMEIRTTMHQGETETLVIEFIDEDTIRMVPPNLAVLERAFQFTRIK